VLSIGPHARITAAAFSLGALLTLASPAMSAPLESRATGSWVEAARKLTMPVFKPTKTFGMRLAFVNVISFDPGCVNDGRDQLRAFYGQQAGRFLEVFEGHPRYCIDKPIDAPVAREARIHGKTARLHKLGGSRIALEWCEKGTTITLVSEGVTADRLIVIGRSTRAVDSAKALPCAF
jgi:hypothetical protein